MFQLRNSLASALVSFAGTFHEISNFKLIQISTLSMKFDILLLFRLQTLDKFLHFPSTKKTLSSGGASFCLFKSPFSTLKGTFRAIAKKINKQTNKQTKNGNKQNKTH